MIPWTVIPRHCDQPLKCLLALLILGSVTPSCDTGRSNKLVIHKIAPHEIGLVDLAGQPVKPLKEEGGQKAIVFFFLQTDCPISNRYAPEIRRLVVRYASQGIKFWLVYTDANESNAQIEQHLKEFALPSEILLDPEHFLVQAAAVLVTPEASVFTPLAQLLYHGRIDDRYMGLGKERPEATRHDLQEVLEAILQGNPVAPHSAPAYGCYIRQLR